MICCIATTLIEHKLTMKTVICALLFLNFFIDKIAKLSDSVSDTLRSLAASLPSYTSFPPHCGSSFNTLTPVTADEVHKLLSSFLLKSSIMDTIPTSLILHCQSVFSQSLLTWPICRSLKADFLINLNKHQ